MKRLFYTNLIQNFGLAVNGINLIGAFLQCQFNADARNTVLVGFANVLFAVDFESDLFAFKGFSLSAQQLGCELCLLGLFA